jgi:hypothetical protein
MGLRRANIAQYAVMIHGYNLIIPDSSGEKQVGGVRTWRYVRARDRDEAVMTAIRVVANDEVFLNHIQNPAEFPPAFEATRVVVLERDDLHDGDGTALVFYIDTAEPEH